MFIGDSSDHIYILAIGTEVTLRRLWDHFDLNVVGRVVEEAKSGRSMDDTYDVRHRWSRRMRLLRMVMGQF